jgi:hypothetical protein
MNSNDILTLLRAGYSKAEIEAMDQPAPAEPEQTPAEPEQTQPEPAPTPAEPEQTQKAPEDGYAKLESLLNQFINTAQTANLNANMAGGMQQKSTTDILAGVIAPPAKKERTNK